MPSSSAAVLALLLLVPLPSFSATISEELAQAETLIQKEQFPQAELLLVKLARQEAGNVEVLYRLGYVQYRQRKLAPARQTFSTIVKIAPPAYNSRYFLGRIALFEAKPKEAITWLEPVIESGQPVFDTAAQLAAAYASAGQHAKAVASLRSAIAQTPWDGGLHYRLGQSYRQLGQAEMAKEAFGASARLKNLSRKDVETLMQVSQALRDSKGDQAAQLGASILERADTDPDTVVALGVLYGTANLQQQALAAFDIAATRNADLFQAQFNRGLALLKLNRSQEAIPPLERAVDLLPQSVEANITLGLARAMNQQYKEAIAPLSRGWQMDDSNPRVGSLLATAYLRTGEAAKAAPILQGITRKPQPDPAALLLLVEALNASHDTTGALKAAQTAAEQFSTVPQAHLALAQQLARLGRYQEARPAFEAVLRLSPGQPEAELGVADTLQKAGEHAAAVEHYRAAMKGSSTSLAARIGLARSLTSLRQLDEAARLLEEAIPLQPSDATLHQELSRIYARLGKADLATEQAKIAERLKAVQP